MVLNSPNTKDNELTAKTPKKKKSQFCNGISTSGKHCKLLVVNGEYCRHHKTNNILEFIGIKDEHTMLKKANLLIESSSSSKETKAGSPPRKPLFDYENKDVDSLQTDLKTSIIRS